MDLTATPPLLPEDPVAVRASVVAGIIVAAVGGVVLVGWIWDVESLKAVYGSITMKTNTAIGLLLCGTALAALRWSRKGSTVCAGSAALIGGLTLSEHLVGWDLGIDQWLFIEPPGAAATASPNRMGPNGSISFIVAGLSIYLLARGGDRRAALAQRLAVAGLVLAAVPLVGYVYGAEQLYDIARYTGIALHTAIAFLFLQAGILLARANQGPMAVFLQDGPAGTMLRRLAAPIIAIPIALGYLEISARQADAVDRGLGMALLAVSIIVVLGFIVWLTALAIERTDRARRRAEHDRDQLIISERQARTEAERANQLKDQFLATLSHELRTPLNVILGWTRFLEQATDIADHTRVAGLVAKNGRLLVRLVGDLLDMSRATAGQFQISRAPLMLNAVVESSLESFASAASAKGVELIAELDPQMAPIDADAERIQQIVWNLVSNGVKFTGAGGRVVLRTSAAGNAATLTVSDTGIGFDASFAADVFTPFRQADSSASREQGGLGLGLSIAKHLAELHGGTLTAMSPGLGRGATFTLTLPRCQGQAEPKAPGVLS